MGKKEIQGGRRLRSKYFGVAKARRMWLCGSPEIQLPPPPSERVHGYPHVSRGGPHRTPEGVTHEGVRPGQREPRRGGDCRLGLQISGRDRGKRRRLAAGGMEGEAKEDGAGNGYKAPDQARELPRPRFQSSPLPQTPGFEVPGGQGPQRSEAGWPWGGCGDAGLQRTAVARSARLDAKAGGVAKPRRTARRALGTTTRGRAPGPGAGYDTTPPASLGEESPTVWSQSVCSRENRSGCPYHRGRLRSPETARRERVLFQAQVLGGHPCLLNNL